MPMASVRLVPGVNVEKTLSANEAGVSESQLLRYKDGLLQTMGGWQSFVGTARPTTSSMHARQDSRNTDCLGVGALTQLLVIASSATGNVTPEQTTTNPTPSVSITSGSTIVQVNDPGSGAQVYNSVYFNTPISVGNLLLHGGYKITNILSTGSYQINSSIAASTTLSSAGTLPSFAATVGAANVSVTIPNMSFMGISSLSAGESVTFRASTTLANLSIFGSYAINSVSDSTSFIINAGQNSSATTTATMHASLAQLLYYITVGPQSSGSGFGAGGYGTGGFGSGIATTGAAGTPITAIDWSLANWGEIFLACPKNGAIYIWSPESGFQNVQVVPTASFFNGVIFVSMPQQILVAWKSVQNLQLDTQDNLMVRWSDSEDYTNWVASNQTTAGSFHLPTGSVIMGGLQAPNYGVIWTDIDVWIMQYVGGDVIFNFSRVGTGCGLVGQHAAGVIGNEVYWCGQSSFFKLGNDGVKPIPCTVWDYIFQNTNPLYANKIFCAPNSAFNEISWFFPSINATECDSYVKLNILEGEWDYGLMPRTAWVDVSIFGNPLGIDNTGVVYQHEQGASVPGTPVTSFRTGWWAIAEGNELSFVDYVIPDFKWSVYSGVQDAQVNVTFYAVDYPGDTPRSYGPYTVTRTTEYLTPRIRGRLVSMLVSSNNNVFWRLGNIRYRYAVSGRR